jgi:hypothetical protein
MRVQITLAAIAAATILGCDRGERQLQSSLRAGKSILGDDRYEPECVTRFPDGVLVTYVLEVDSLVQVMDQSVRAIVFVATSGKAHELRASLDSVATRVPESDSLAAFPRKVAEESVNGVRVHCTQGLVGGLRIDVVSAVSRDSGPEVEVLYVQTDPWRVASSIRFR